MSFLFRISCFEGRSAKLFPKQSQPDCVRKTSNIFTYYKKGVEKKTTLGLNHVLVVGAVDFATPK